MKGGEKYLFLAKYGMNYAIKVIGLTHNDLELCCRRIINPTECGINLCCIGRLTT